MWKLNFRNTTQTRSYPSDQIQIVRMPNISDTNWVLAEPHIMAMTTYLNNLEGSNLDIYISLTFSFSRKVFI